LVEKIQSSEHCEQWEYRVSYGYKENKYVFLLQRDSNQNPIPVYYLMMGYDSLHGAHYDKNKVLNEAYWTGKIDPAKFDIQTQYKCRGFPGPGAEGLALMNPIREFVDDGFEPVDDHFDSFRRRHNKSYDANEELNYRKNIFRHNYRFIMSHNRK